LISEIDTSQRHASRERRQQWLMNEITLISKYKNINSAISIKIVELSLILTCRVKQIFHRPHQHAKARQRSIEQLVASQSQRTEMENLDNECKPRDEKYLQRDTSIRIFSASLSPPAPRVHGTINGK